MEVASLGSERDKLCAVWGNSWYKFFGNIGAMKITEKQSYTIFWESFKRKVQIQHFENKCLIKYVQ